MVAMTSRAVDTRRASGSSFLVSALGVLKFWSVAFHSGR